MTPERRAQTFEVLTRVLAAATEERAELLTQLCEDDGELRREVEARLAHAREAEGFLSKPLVESGGPQLGAGERLGPYRVLDVLGHGGMGTVYRAVREDDFEKQVAIKLIQGGSSSPAIRRFHDERQILARLEHPAIARLLDGGATEDGRPFLVMEHVRGISVDHYCDERHLTTRERLELFCRIADAVAYAHQNLVVHRDLKPGNILVTEEGVPKLLDFGIAKLLEEDPARTNVTVGQGPMTPRYASPEQILGEAVTTASDVYALGLLLYLLLTGRLPNELGSCTYQEITRRICNEEPLRPSTVVLREKTVPRGEDAVTRSNGEKPRTPESVSRVRDGDPKKLRRSLTGDVDAIVLKALRKEPRHRYGSVEAMAEDVRRHLGGRPVRARKGTWTYRTGKLVRRHKWGVAAVLLVAVLSVASTVLWRRAVAEGRRAEQGEAEALRERTRAERVSDFLLRLFKSANPDSAQGGTVTVREVVDQGRARLLAGDEHEDPEIAAAIAGTLGDVYRNLGLYDEALELLEHSEEIRRRLYPEGHADLVAILNDLASAYYYVGRYGEAEDHFRKALAMRRRLGQEPASIALALSNLAAAVKQQGRYGEAGELYREVLRIRTDLFGPEHADVGSTLYSLGTLYYEEGDLESAETALRRALATRITAHGERHTRVATVRNSLGRVLMTRGRLAEAEKLLRRVLATRRELLGDEHDHVALTARDLAELLLMRGETAEAGELLEEALAVLRRSKPHDDWTIADTEGVYGAWLAAQGRYEEAEPYVVSAYEAVRLARGGASIRTRQARERVEALYEAWGMPQRAAPWGGP